MCSKYPVWWIRLPPRSETNRSRPLGLTADDQKQLVRSHVLQLLFDTTAAAQDLALGFATGAPDGAHHREAIDSELFCDNLVHCLDSGEWQIRID